MAREHLKNSIHTSSYYLLKTLAFLDHQMLSTAELRERFAEDEACAVNLSTDTIRLYLLALEKGGCVLKRETHNGQLRYKLDHSPFCLQFTIEEWIDFLEAFEAHLNTTQLGSFFQFYSFGIHLLEKPFLSIGHKRELAALLESYLPREYFALTKQLSSPGKAGGLYLVQYQSKSQTHEWVLLNDAVVIEQKRLYWLCYRIDPEALNAPPEPKMLRMNRCRSIHPIPFKRYETLEERPLRERVRENLKAAPRFSTLIVLPKGINFEAPGLQGESVEPIPPMHALDLPYMDEMLALFERPVYVLHYSVRTLHYFYVCQRLKASGGFLLPQNEFSRLQLLQEEAHVFA